MDICSRLGPIPDNIHIDCSDNLNQRSRRIGVFHNMGPLPERRSTISNMMPSHNLPLANANTRMRNLSGGSSGSAASSSTGSSAGSTLSVDNNHYHSDNQFFGHMESISSHNMQNRVNAQAAQASTLSHRKLDRSLSDSDSDRSSSQRSVNASRYKTELCRPFQESGSCKYGDKCQFAHGYTELRNVSRHPKYKTEPCRTFHTTGFCPYGPRCHFLHEAESSGSSGKVESSPKLSRACSHTSGRASPALSPTSDADYSTFTYQPEPTNDFVINKQFNRDINSIERQFSTALNFRSNPPPHPVNDNIFGGSIGVFSSGNKREPKPIGTEENDIFSQITMFNCQDLQCDNDPQPQISNPFSSSSMQNMNLNNFTSFVDTSCWNNSGDIFSKTHPTGPAFQHSPTGSMASTGSSGSDCSGSTDSLSSSSGYRDLGTGGGPFSPFSNWISGFWLMNRLSIIKNCAGV